MINTSVAVGSSVGGRIRYYGGPRITARDMSVVVDGRAMCESEEFDVYPLVFVGNETPKPVTRTAFGPTTVVL